MLKNKCFRNLETSTPSYEAIDWKIAKWWNRNSNFVFSSRKKNIEKQLHGKTCYRYVKLGARILSWNVKTLAQGEERRDIIRSRFEEKMLKRRHRTAHYNHQQIRHLNKNKKKKKRHYKKYESSSQSQFKSIGTREKKSQVLNVPHGGFYDLSDFIGGFSDQNFTMVARNLDYFYGLGADLKKRKTWQSL